MPSLNPQLRTCQIIQYHSLLLLLLLGLIYENLQNLKMLNSQIFLLTVLVTASVAFLLVQGQQPAPANGQAITLGCKSDSDCTSQTAHSVCSTTSGQCLCQLGYKQNGTQCLPYACTNSTDCTALFPNTVCTVDGQEEASNATGSCICNSAYSLNVHTQHCDIVISSSMSNWWIGLGVLIFLALLLTGTTYLWRRNRKDREASASKRLLEENSSAENRNGSGNGNGNGNGAVPTANYQSISDTAN